VSVQRSTISRPWSRCGHQIISHHFSFRIIVNKHIQQQKTRGLSLQPYSAISFPCLTAIKLQFLQTYVHMCELISTNSASDHYIKVSL